MNALDEVLRSPSPDSDYARGALDALALLGLVADQGGSWTPTGKVAAMLLDTLRAHLADGVAVSLDWDDLDGPPPRGVDVIRAIEQARLARVERPTPARIVQAAQSIIKSRRGMVNKHEDAYLLQYDRHAGRYQPLGGKREPFETDLADTLRRELAEELKLPAPPGEESCRLELIGQGWVETTPSPTYGLLTQYTFAFYHIVEARFSLMLDADTRWLARSEIASGRAADGRAISPIYQQALGLAALDALAATRLPGP